MAWWRGGEGGPTDEAHAQAVAAADESVKNLQRVFLATPYRPTGLSLASRTVVRLVDELNWLIIVIQAGADPKRFSINPAVCAVKEAAAEVLEHSADLLVDSKGRCEELTSALAELAAALAELERDSTADLPVPRIAAPLGQTSESGEPEASEVITALEPSFRAQELSFAVSLIGHNIELMVAADRGAGSIGCLDINRRV